MSDILQWQTIIDDQIRQNRRKVSIQELEDLRQDLYVAILETKANTAESVMKVCHNVLSGKRTIETESLDDPKLQTSPISQEFFRDKTRHARVKEAVDSLPEQERYVIHGRFYQDLKIDELAAEMGQTPAWVRKTEERAKVAIAKFLSRKEKPCR